MSARGFEARFVLLLVLICLAAISACSVASGPQRTILDRSGTITGRASQSFDLRVKRGERLRIVLGQSGLDVYLQLSLDGEPLGRFDSFTGRYGEERVLLQPTRDGILQLTVGSLRMPGVTGKFRLEVIGEVPADEADRLFTDASRDVATSRPPQRIQQFMEAARVFAAQGRKREEGLASFAALTLLNLTASDARLAIENGERAVVALRQGSDVLLKAAALNGLAAAYGEAKDLPNMERNFTEARADYLANGSDIGVVEADLFRAALSDDGSYSVSLLGAYLDTVRKCAALREKVCEAFALIDLAGQVRSRGDFRLAFDYLFQTFPLLDSSADSGAFAELQDTLASTFRMIGDFDAALVHHERALQAFDRFGECSGISRSYYGIGYALLGIGDSEQALRFYKLALGRNCAVGVAQHLEPRPTSRTEGARELCEAAAAFVAFDTDDRAVASWTTWDLGNLARSMYDPELALRCHEIATTLATRDRHVLGTQLERVRDYLDLGRTRDAAALISVVDENVLKENPWYQAQKSEVDAQLGASLGRYQYAVSQYAEAATQYGKVKNFEGAFSALERRASLASAAGDRHAEIYFAEAESALEDVRLLSLDPLFSARLFASGRRIYEQWIGMQLASARDTTPRSALRTLAISERSRARLLAQVAAAAKVGQEGRQSRLSSLAGSTLVVLKAAEAGKLPPEDLPRETSAYSVTNLNRALGLRRGPMNTQVIDEAVDDIDRYRRSLDERTAVVEYFLGEHRSYAWVLRKAGARRVELGDADAIRRAATDLATLFGSRASANDAKAALAELYRLVWQPLQVPDQINRVEIVPDDVLHEVPFVALWDSTRGKYLLELATFSNIPSIQFAASRERSFPALANLEGALLIGDPVYDLGDARGRCSPDAQGVDAPKLRRIPASRRELKQIDALLRARNTPTALLTGCEANREEFLELRKRAYQYVHFATHATADREVPQRSAIFLSAWNETGRPTAGAVTAADFLDFPLRSGLVVLSGCSTAGGRQIGGEGSLGLTFSLLAGGSQRVISTLWPVADAASELAMTDLYTGLVAEHESVDDALRSAQLKMLGNPQWNSPRHWAAYSLLGT